MPGLLARIAAAAWEADKAEGWGLLQGKTLGTDVGVRVIEYHTYEAGGKLVDPEHTDAGSLVTVDILLSDRFEGGHLETPNAGGAAPTRHTFELGDALLFPSEKYHGVSRVVGGTRHALIVEFWDGPDRRCAHYCPSSSMILQSTVADRMRAHALLINPMPDPHSCARRCFAIQVASRRRAGTTSTRARRTA